jgi:RimJ/RimL family protein N-acetyltransferase
MPAIELAIRPAMPSDAEALSTCMNALADEELPQLSGLRQSPDEERTFLEKTTETAGAFVLIALTGDRVVGMLDLWPGQAAYDRHTARLGMSVLAPFRRQGLGRRMLATAIDTARQSPCCRRISLEVVPWNEAAVRLYEQAGFEREGTLRQAAILGGEMVDLMLMALVW